MSKKWVSTRFASPTQSFDLDVLVGRLRKGFALSVGIAAALHLVVAGINPGSNVGRSVYHSGTVGAALTARNGAICGVAVSQAVSDWGVEGQGMDEVLDRQLWSTAAEVAQLAVEALINELPPAPRVLIINVPNLTIGVLQGW